MDKIIAELAKEAYMNDVRIRVARIYINSTGCIDGERKNILLKILGGNKQDEDNTDIR